MDDDIVALYYLAFPKHPCSKTMLISSPRLAVHLLTTLFPKGLLPHYRRNLAALPFIYRDHDECTSNTRT